MIFPTSSGFEVHCYKQETDEARQEIWEGRKPVPEGTVTDSYQNLDTLQKKVGGRDSHIKLKVKKPTSRRDKKRMAKAMAPNLVHSVDASVIHAVLANMGSNESVVTVHDAVGTHLRDVGLVRELFQKSFHHAYGHENHPLQLLKGDPHSSDTDPEALYTLGEIRNKALKSKHMI